jgi:hypothetical protein
MPVVPSAKRTRTAINEDIKQQIYVYTTKPENKNKTQQQVADYFNQQNQAFMHCKLFENKTQKNITSFFMPNNM